MNDPRDVLSEQEQQTIKDQKKYLIINQYLPDGLESKEEVQKNQVENKLPLVIAKTEDKTILSKESRLKGVFVLLVIIIVIIFLIIFFTKTEHKRRLKDQLPNSNSLIETKSHIITDVDIESTMTGQGAAGANLAKPVKSDQIKIGDKVTYEGAQDQKNVAKRNYNTPLFIKAEGNMSFGNSTSPKLPLPPNSYVRVYLDTEINSSNIKIPVSAIAYMDLVVSGNILIPNGSRLVGSMSRGGNGRVGLVFHTAIIPDGREYGVRGQAVGDDNIAGLAVNIDHNVSRKGANIFAKSLLGAASDSFTLTGNSFGSVFAGNVAGETADTVDDSINDVYGNNKVTFTVPANVRFKIVFSQ